MFNKFGSQVQASYDIADIADQLVTFDANSYVKEGDVQDTVYFSEETSARFYADERVVVVLNRPALSNTYTFKTGENVDNIQFAILQTDDSGNRAWGTASV